MGAGLFEQQAFTTRAEGFERILEAALARMPGAAGWRVLDVGCADGGTLFALAEARPDASLVGVDISHPNIAAAERRLTALGDPERLRFVAGDYLTTPVDGRFDLVIASGSLHLVEGEDDELARRLAGDLREGGLLLVEMPYACLVNRGLVVARRVLRRLRTPALERLVLAVARRLHSGTMSGEQLDERLVYLYVVPERLAGRRWERSLARHGLRRLARSRMRHASVAELRAELRLYENRPHPHGSRRA